MSCCPGGPLLVTPYNLCTLVAHHWTDTCGCCWTNPGKETADSLLSSVMCREVALLITHFSLCCAPHDRSALLPWRSVYPAKGLVHLQYHRGSSSKTETMVKKKVWLWTYFCWLWVMLKVGAMSGWGQIQTLQALWL